MTAGSSRRARSLDSVHLRLGLALGLPRCTALSSFGSVGELGAGYTGMDVLSCCVCLLFSSGTSKQENAGEGAIVTPREACGAQAAPARPVDGGSKHR